jgi:diguanylate cyclase (GGDEF)-like protein
VSKDRRKIREHHSTLQPIGTTNDESDKTVRIKVGQNPEAPKDTNGCMTIRVVAGRDMLSFVILKSGSQILIGRDERADLRLQDRAVSSRHAVVNYNDNREISIIDIGSTNGTLVNGVRIQNSPLQDGDYVEIGDASLRVSWQSMSEVMHQQRVLKRLNAANTDPLTGLLTRSYLQEDAEKLLQVCITRKIPLSCAFIDLDKFKPINDTFGHQIGDEVLKNVGRIILMKVRSGDPCIRYGGDEILLLFPGIDEKVAQQVVNRIRTSILRHEWSRIAVGLTLSASFGVSSYIPGDSFENVLNKADKAVYVAKKKGRNQVVVYHEDIEK